MLRRAAQALSRATPAAQQRVQQRHFRDLPSLLGLSASPLKLTRKLLRISDALRLSSLQPEQYIEAVLVKSFPDVTRPAHLALCKIIEERRASSWESVGQHIRYRFFT